MDAATEMSWARMYENIDCMRTMQWRRKKRSCWDYFEYKFEGAYDGIFVPVIKPDERYLPPGTDYFDGPNNTFNDVIDLQVDVTRDMIFLGANDVSSAFDELWTITDTDGNVLPGINVEVIQVTKEDLPIMRQGTTSDDGQIWLVGLNHADGVIAGGKYASEVDSSGEIQEVYLWMFGYMDVFGSEKMRQNSGEVIFELSAVQGQFPLICSAVLNDSLSFDYKLSVGRQFSSLPTLEFETYSGGAVVDTFSQNGPGYLARITFDSLSQGAVRIKAVDDSSNSFFFGTDYIIARLNDSARITSVISSDGMAELELDSIDAAAISRVAILSSPFPIIREGLQAEFLQVGPTYSVSVYPAGSLSGLSNLSLKYDPNIYPLNANLSINPQSLSLFRWNESLTAWEMAGGVVDTSAEEVSIEISQTGIFALFAADVITDIGEDDITQALPSSFELLQNFPNPFNPSTTVQFNLPQSSQVEIAIYNILGQEVRLLINESKPAGRHQVTWDGTDNRGKPVTSGLYFYRITTDQYTMSKKMLLLK